MPRNPKPFVHRGWYVTDLGGTRHKLCRVEDGRQAAEDALLDLRQEQRRLRGCRFERLTVDELVALFLESIQVEVAADTYKQLKRFLGVFCRDHGRLKVSEITPLLADTFRNKLARSTWQSKYARAEALQAEVGQPRYCWHWGDEKKVIPPGNNPFIGVKPLETADRERVMEDHEFQALLQASRHAEFRQFLLTLRYTGARPGELVVLTSPQVNWNAHCFIFQRHKTSKKTKVPRVILFPPVIERLLRWRQRHFGDAQTVFLNRRGDSVTRAWTVQRMKLTRERAGLGLDANGEKLVLYTNRHTFSTAGALTPDIGDGMLPKLAGHTNPKMTARYTHLRNHHMYEANLKVADKLRLQRRIYANSAPPIPGPATPATPPGLWVQVVCSPARTSVHRRRAEPWLPRGCRATALAGRELERGSILTLTVASRTLTALALQQQFFLSGKLSIVRLEEKRPRTV